MTREEQVLKLLRQAEMNLNELGMFIPKNTLGKILAKLARQGKIAYRIEEIKERNPFGQKPKSRKVRVYFLTGVRP